jgi:hypothetical protein
MRTPSRSRPTSLSRFTPIAAALASAMAAQAFAACPTAGTGPLCVTKAAVDGTPGSLNAAINSANTNCSSVSAPVIEFDIPGTGPFVLNLPNSLSFFCSAPIAYNPSIDGFSQPGSAPNGNPTGFNPTHQVILNGADNVSGGISFNGFNYGGALTVKGLQFQRFTYGGPSTCSSFFVAAVSGPVRVLGSFFQDNCVGVAANAIDADGTMGSGSQPGPSQIGDGTSVGRNAFANHYQAAISLAYGGFPGHLADINNNFIGTKDGTTSGGGPGKGVDIRSPGVVADPNMKTTIRNNVISGNGSHGVFVELASYGATIQGNKIGTAVGGTALGNSGDGIRSSSSQNVLVLDNTIAFNGGSGFNIPFGTGNELSGNRIHSNGVKAINLGDVPSPVPNDTNDGDGGANNLQNYPVITSVVKNAAANNTTINWNLDSETASNFAIEFFSNPTASATGQATNFLDPATYIPGPAGGSTGAGNFISGNTTIPGLHDFITATATRLATAPNRGNTSELGAAAVAKGVALAPTSIDFGNVVVGSTSGTGTATLSSLGSGAAQITQISGTSLCYGGPAPICGGSQFTCTTTCATGTFTGGTSCSFAASFSPISLGAQTTTIYICDDAGGNPARTLTLTGNAVVPPPATVAPASHDFGAVEVGGTSPTQSFLISNPAPVPTTLTPVTVTAPFQIFSNSCGATLSAGGGCTVVVKYAPTTVGTSSGTLSATAGTGAVSAALAGTATAGAPPTLTPPSVDFGAVTVGTNSAFATFTLTNPALTSIPVGSFAVTPGYALGTVTCTSSLPPGGSCTAQVKFQPVAPGVVTGALSVSAGGGTFSSSLTGTGTASPVLTLTPAAHDFGGVLLGASSGPKSFLIQNPSPVSSSLSVATSAPFQVVSTTCGSTIAANGSCSANVTFVPTAEGPASAALVATSSSGTSGASLTGTGVRQPGVSMPTSTIEFGSMIVNSAPVFQTIQLRSTGNTTLGINSISVSPPFTHTTTCGVSLAQNDTCNITVGFNPTVIGDFTGFLSVSTNAPGGSFLQAPLHAGVQKRPEPVLQVLPRTINFGARFSGGEPSPPQNVTVRNEGGSVATLELILNVPSFSIVNSRCGATLAPGASCDIEIGFSPQGYGPKNGDLVVRSNAANGTQGVSLSGASCRPVTFAQSRGSPAINCSP